MISTKQGSLYGWDGHTPWTGEKPWEGEEPWKGEPFKLTKFDV